MYKLNIFEQLPNKLNKIIQSFLIQSYYKNIDEWDEEEEDINDINYMIYGLGGIDYLYYIIEIKRYEIIRIINENLQLTDKKTIKFNNENIENIKFDIMKDQYYIFRLKCYDKLGKSGIDKKELTYNIFNQLPNEVNEIIGSYLVENINYSKLEEKLKKMYKQKNKYKSESRKKLFNKIMKHEKNYNLYYLIRDYKETAKEMNRYITDNMGSIEYIKTLNYNVDHEEIYYKTNTIKNNKQIIKLYKKILKHKKSVINKMKEFDRIKYFGSNI